MKTWVRTGMVLVAVALLVACETTSPTPPPPPTLEGNIITDPAVGFRGTRIVLPADYRRHMPLVGVTNAPDSAQWVWEATRDYDRKVPGFHLRYQFAFGTEDNRGISVAVIETFAMHPPPGEELGWESELAKLFMSAASGSPNLDLKNYRKLKSYHVAQAGWKLPEAERYASIVVMTLPPGRLLVLSAVSPDDQRDTLLRDLNAVAESVAPLK